MFCLLALPPALTPPEPLLLPGPAPFSGETGPVCIIPMFTCGGAMGIWRADAPDCHDSDDWAELVDQMDA
jgi:hypothetical protein